MSRAFMKEAEQAEPRCPGCGGLGAPVAAKTLEAQLPADARATLGDGVFYCAGSDCDTAYFNAWGGAVSRARSRACTYPKDPGGLLCPCFGIKAADIVEDARAGRKERIKDLRERAGGPEARCLTACPDGQSCLPLALRLFRENFPA